VSRTQSRPRWIRHPKKAGDGCARCAGRYSCTMSTSGRVHSWTRWRLREALNRS